MPNIIESYRSAVDEAKDRTNPDGVAVSAVIGGFALPSMTAIETAFATTIHELTSGDPNLVRLGLVALAGIANVASIRAESTALRDKEFSASLGGTAWNIVTGRPTLSAAVDHVANYTLINVANPVNAIAIFNNDAQLLTDSVIATLLTKPLWDIPFNHLISKGTVDPVVKRMKEFRENIGKRIRRKPQEKSQDLSHLTKE